MTDIQWLVPYYPAVFLAKVAQVGQRRWANPENKRPENWGHPELGWTPDQGGWPFTPVELTVVEWLKLPQLTKEQEETKFFALDEAARMRVSPPPVVTLDVSPGAIIGKENTAGSGWPELREGDQAIFICAGPYKYVSGDLQVVTFHCSHGFPVTSNGLVADSYDNVLPLDKALSLIKQATQNETSPPTYTSPLPIPTPF